MRLSRLLIVMAAAFSASAFAVSPPGADGSLQDEGAKAPQSSSMTPSIEEREREGNAWLSSNPSNAWQSSARRESESAQEPERTAMRGDPPLPAEVDTTPAPLLVPERMPATGEQS